MGAHTRKGRHHRPAPNSGRGGRHRVIRTTGRGRTLIIGGTAACVALGVLAGSPLQDATGRPYRWQPETAEVRPVAPPALMDEPASAPEQHPRPPVLGFASWSSPLAAPLPPPLPLIDAADVAVRLGPSAAAAVGRPDQTVAPERPRSAVELAPASVADEPSVDRPEPRSDADGRQHGDVDTTRPHRPGVHQGGPASPNPRHPVSTTPNVPDWHDHHGHHRPPEPDDEDDPPVIVDPPPVDPLPAVPPVVIDPDPTAEPAPTPEPEAATDPTRATTDRHHRDARRARKGHHR